MGLLTNASYSEVIASRRARATVQSVATSLADPIHQRDDYRHIVNEARYSVYPDRQRVTSPEPRLMPIDERAINGHIAEALEEQAPPGFAVIEEEHGNDLFGDRVPDIQLRLPYRLRVIIETEYGAPAIGDARKKLGWEFKDDGDLPMKSILAVGIPEELGDAPRAQRRATLSSDQPIFQLQVVTGTGPKDPNITIVPKQPVAVSLRDLIHYAWLAAIPEDYSRSELNKVVQALTRAKLLLLDRLKMYSLGVQTELRMAYDPGDTGLAAVAGNVVGTLTSMMQLHLCLKEWASGGLEDVLPLDGDGLFQQGRPRHGIPHNIAFEWRKIETVNYRPLSTLAANMIQDRYLTPHLGAVLRIIREALTKYVGTGISATTNVAAEIWQSLIPDRDQRAAYYTKPVTAEMLANLTVPRLSNPAEATYNEVCAGTGTLARATEENIRFRHYANTDDKSSIHARRMEQYIRLTDINQQSVSVASASMASLEPDTPYSTNAIFAITSEGGALNYLTRDGLSDMESALIGINGNRTDMLNLEQHSAGICNNNDPYFVARRGAKNPIPRAKMSSFKAQADRRLKGVANANAGLASFMHVIEHELLSFGGVHGKVLPLKAAHAHSYSGFRRNMELAYRNVIAICTAAGDGTSMSADTNVQEMLVVGTKQPEPPINGCPEVDGDRSITCVNLTRTFATRIEAKMFADTISREVALGSSYGNITVGDVVGTYYRMTDLGEGSPWWAMGSSGNYTRLIGSMTSGVAWNIGTGATGIFSLPMTNLGTIVLKGPTHDRIGIASDSRGTHPRGAFLLRPMREARHDSVRTNHSIWNEDSEQQLRITCAPTHFGEPRSTPEQAEEMLHAAGNFHLSRNLRTSSQKIAVAYTEEPCMGGQAWNTFKADEDIAKSIALFLNSTFGIVVRSGYGNSANPGRSRVQVRAIDGHPIPDFAADTPAATEARRIAVENFDRLRILQLDRIALAAIDPNRHEIDRVVSLMLGLPWNIATENMLARWRELMCLQPTINANNKGVLASLAAHGIR